MKTLMPLLVAALLLGTETAACAHPLPKTATPKPNSLLATSPTEIRISFSEGLVAAFSGMEVDAQNGTPVVTGDATLNPNDDRELIVAIKVKLVPGSYTVKWHAVGDDTHHVSGHYSFQVKA